MQKLDRLGWAASSTFRIGEWHIGVRSKTFEADELVRRFLSSYLTEGIEAPANFSVVLRTPGDEQTTLSKLYRDHSTVVRSPRRPSRVLKGLAEHLSEYLDLNPKDLLKLRMAALVRDGEAILVPASIVVWMDTLVPRLNGRGAQLLDAPFAMVDPTRGELVVLPPPLDVDETIVQLLDAQADPGVGSEPPPVLPGRYPVRGLSLFSGAGAEVRPLSLAASLAGAAPYVHNHPALGTAFVVESLRRLFAGFGHPLALGSPYEGDLATRLLSTSGSGDL